MSSITLPSYDIPISVDGVLFNVQDGDRILRISQEQFTGWWDGPELDAPSTPRSTGHGSFVEEGRAPSRMVIMGGTAECETEESAVRTQRELSSLLAGGSKGELLVEDPRLPAQYARVQRVGKPLVDWYMPGLIRFQFTLLAADPRKYGPPVSVTTGPPMPGGGLVFPLFTGTAPGVLDFGPPGDTGMVSFVNDGSADSAALLRVDGPAPGFTITETTTGRRLVYAATIPAGSWLDLNPYDGTVLLDGYADRSTLLAVREWVRTPMYSASTFLFETANPDARMTVTGRSAWW